LDNLVSILIPNYNKGKYLKETLDSVLSQTYTNWECIIVDDHSTDNSWDIFEEYARMDSRFNVVKRPIHLNKGGSVCRNHAFTISRGDYITWFDSDDIMPKKSLESRYLVLHQSSFDFVFGRIASFRSESSAYELYHPNISFLESTNLALDYFLGNFWIGTPMPLFKKSYLIKQTQLFNEKLKRNQEAEFFIRLLLKNPRIFQIEDLVALWRKDDFSISGIYENKNQGEKLLINYPFFKLIIRHFSNSYYWNDNTKSLFSFYYIKYLKRINVHFFSYFELLYIGFKFNLIKSNFLTNRIFISRLLKKYF
jgi:glycosyltransferase involved in cell wall biosynthesis